jgi:replicative DNA helicase
MLEQTILAGLIFDEEYARRVLPFLKDTYFRDGQQTILRVIQSYIAKYNKRPTPDAIAIDLQNLDGLAQSTFDSAKEFLVELERPDVDTEWLLDVTEQFCQDRAVYNAVVEAMGIIEDKNGKLDRGSIPKILQDALGVSFDQSVGHDYFDDADERFEFYHRHEEHIPFDIDLLNEITKGGLLRKTLNIILAGTNVGKSLMMCHMASANLTRGLNVLYITLEMSQERIAERIDANLLDVSLDDLADLPQDAYNKKMDRVRAKTAGKLVIKEFPTASAHAGHFRHLLHELKLKKNFVPDVIYIDYLNICASSRMKMGNSVNSYTYVKSIAEELRGLAVEFNVPIVSATQTNRGGFDNSDVTLTDTSESFGLPATCDLMIAVMTTEELEQLGQFLVKQLKNRYAGKMVHRRFTVGVDYNKMRLFNVEQKAQEDIMDDTVTRGKDTPLNQFGERERKSGIKPFRKPTDFVM